MGGPTSQAKKKIPQLADVVMPRRENCRRKLEKGQPALSVQDLGILLLTNFQSILYNHPHNAFCNSLVCRPKE